MERLRFEIFFSGVEFLPVATRLEVQGPAQVSKHEQPHRFQPSVLCFESYYQKIGNARRVNTKNNGGCHQSLHARPSSEHGRSHFQLAEYTL
jgi:hypothetical protein